MAIWPGDLPDMVMVDGFGLTEADGRLRSATDTGPGRMRRANGAAPMLVRCQLPPLDPDQQMTARRFWNTDLGGGVKPFWVRDLVFDGLPLSDEGGGILLDENDQPLLTTDWWLVQFGPAPNWAAKPGMLFTPAFTLEVLP